MKQGESLNRIIWGIPLSFLILRIVMQGILFPWELSGDEAQYWDWTRNPSLSYYTKGPGVPWLITAMTSFFGDTILGIRSGTFLCHAIAGIAVGLLARTISKGQRNVVLYSSLGFQCVLAYQVSGSLMTVDMMMVAGWLVATVAAVETYEKILCHESVKGPLAWMGIGLGFAFLAKYTALLGLLGIVLGLWPVRKKLISAKGFSSGITMCAVFFLLGVAPVVIWNATRGWPTVSHLLGHLHVEGGDSGTTSWLDFNPMWTVTYFLQVLGLAGPFLGYILFRGSWSTWKRRDSAPGSEHVALWSALPVLIFYLLVSIKGSTEGNWMAGAYGPLIPLGACWLLRETKPGLQSGLTKIIAARSLFTGFILLSLPFLGPLLNEGLKKWDATPLSLHRISGHSTFATDLHRLLTDNDLLEQPIVCDYYDKTALLAFYLPNKPAIHCASVILGSRPSAYDDFESTRFPQERHLNKKLVFVGADESRWKQHLDLSSLEPLGMIKQRNRPREIFVGTLNSLKGGSP